MVVDEQSQFDGDARLADAAHPAIQQFQDEGSVAMVRATTSHPYPDVELDRIVALVDNVAPERPVVIDIFSTVSERKHRFDLPIHFEGQHIATNSPANWTETANLQPLGAAHGYEHLWLRSRHAVAEGDSFGFTWLQGNRFYSVISNIDAPSEALFTQLGANDPNFNLRPQHSLLRRVEGVQNATFVSVFESHGEYNGAAEFTVNNKPTISQISFTKKPNAQLVRIKNTSNETFYVAFALESEASAIHQVTVDGNVLSWRGFAAVFNEGGNPI